MNAATCLADGKSLFFQRQCLYTFRTRQSFQALLRGERTTLNLPPSNLPDLRITSLRTSSRAFTMSPGTFARSSQNSGSNSNPSLSTHVYPLE